MIGPSLKNVVECALLVCSLLDLFLCLNFPFWGFRPVETDLDRRCLRNLDFFFLSGVLSELEELPEDLLSTGVVPASDDSFEIWSSEDTSVLEVQSVDTYSGIVASFTASVSMEGQAGKS